MIESSPALAVLCPAKINLMLHVVGRRDDGYHELDTVFQAIELHDRIVMRPSDSLELSCSDPGLAVDGSNLVLRAVALLAQAAEVSTLTAAIHLEKSIPVGGGLGGGSSDAAAACSGWGTASGSSA